MEIDIKIPSVGESVTEVILASWLVTNGEYVEMDQLICELESDKATLELPAEKAGKLIHVAQEGDTLEIGQVVCKIDVEAKAPEKAKLEIKEEPKKEDAKIEVKKEVSEKIEAPVTQQKESSKAISTGGHPSPVAAKMMKENGIQATAIHGTGVSGRITKQDVLNYMQNGGSVVVQGSGGMIKGDFSRTEERKKMSTLRRTIARRLVAAKNETAMLTTFNEVDLTEVIAIRKQYKEKFKEVYGVSLGYMSFFTRAVCLALQEFPGINAQIEGEEVLYQNFCDISIAVSTPRGLVVPVIRNAESMSLHEIETTIKDLAIRGRDGKLSMDEMTGGTFTITNGGVFGSLMSTPIINQPQSAILGMHKIQDRPMAINGEVVIRPMMYLAMSYDHRIVDGKESVSFLVRVKENLEDPNRLLSGNDPVKTLLEL